MAKSKQLMASVFLALLSGTTSVAATGCTIAINGGLPDPQPLVLKTTGGNDGFAFQLPNTAGVVAVAANVAVRLVCAGSTNYFTVLGSTTRDILATCVSATTFSVSGVNYQFSALKCYQLPVHSAVRSGASCYNGNSLVDIGFQVGATFIKIIQTCFDDTKLNSVWSKYTLVAGIGGEQVGFPRPGFVEAGFYPGVSADTQYTRATQTATFATLLGSTTLANQLISPTTTFYLARGHLTANTDFVYGAQHRATFYFINAAPQWETLNAGNWLALEDDVRALASTRALNLEVYTGTAGIVTFANTAGVMTPMYLFRDANNNLQIPVPAVFWKIIYNPATQLGVAVLGVNNPYLAKAQLGSLYWLCTDVSAQVPWLTWAPNNQTKGIGYCCDVNQLRSVVPSIPSFPVVGLLV